MPKVSIIIPNYNYAKFLGTAVNSCLNQKEFGDFDVVIIDDGSEDSSVEIGKRLAELSPDKVKFYQIKHSGRSKARNYGIEITDSKYLVFLDADDFLHRSFLLEMVWSLDLMVECPFAYSYYYLYCPPHRMLMTPLKFDGDRFDFAGGIPITALVQRKLVEKNGGFDERLDIFEDCDFWLKLIQFGIPHLVPLGLWYYRRHNENSTYFSKENLKKIIAFKKVVKENWESKYKNVDFEKIEKEMEELPLVCEDCVVNGCELFKRGWINCCLECPKKRRCAKYKQQGCLVFNPGSKLNNERT